MKLSDITTIKGFFSGLPQAVTTWLLTFFFISTITLGYFGGRHWYYNYLEKQHESFRRDSLMLCKLNVISAKITNLTTHVDSISKHQILQDQKLNTVGKYIQRIDHGNSNILYEFRRMDDLYNIFGSYKAPDAEKKKAVDTTNYRIKWLKVPKLRR
jgi:hypothetical protein